MLLATLLTVAPARASGTATLVSGTVLPHNPAMGGVVRLALQVRNDTDRVWTATDVVRLTWKTSGKTATEESRRLGQAVKPGATVALALVTLSPAAAGDFILTTAPRHRGGSATDWRSNLVPPGWLSF